MKIPVESATEVFGDLPFLLAMGIAIAGVTHLIWRGEFLWAGIAIVVLIIVTAMEVVWQHRHPRKKRLNRDS